MTGPGRGAGPDRTLVVTAAVLLAAALGVGAALIPDRYNVLDDVVSVVGDRAEPSSPTGGPSGSPTAAGSPSAIPTDPAALKALLAGATLTLPPFPGFEDCPSGELTFADGRATAGDLLVIVDPGVREPVLADVVGDPAAEALVRVRCARDTTDEGPIVDALVALSQDGAGGFDTVGYVFAGSEETPGFESFSVADGTVTVTVLFDPFPDADSSERDDRSFRWDGTAFAPA